MRGSTVVELPYIYNCRDTNVKTLHDPPICVYVHVPTVLHYIVATRTPRRDAYTSSLLGPLFSRLSVAALHRPRPVPPEPRCLALLSAVVHLAPSRSRRYAGTRTRRHVGLGPPHDKSSAHARAHADVRGDESLSRSVSQTGFVLPGPREARANVAGPLLAVSSGLAAHAATGPLAEWRQLRGWTARILTRTTCIGQAGWAISAVLVSSRGLD
jgi:hypothetical protein